MYWNTSLYFLLWTPLSRWIIKFPVINSLIKLIYFRNPFTRRKSMLNQPVVSMILSTSTSSTQVNNPSKQPCIILSQHILTAFCDWPMTPSLKKLTGKWNWLIQKIILSIQNNVPIRWMPIPGSWPRCQIQTVVDVGHSSLRWVHNSSSHRLIERKNTHIKINWNQRRTRL